MSNRQEESIINLLSVVYLTESHFLVVVFINSHQTNFSASVDIV